MKGIRYATSYQQESSICKKLMVGDKYGTATLHRAEEKHISWENYGRVKRHKQRNNAGSHSTAMRTKDR
jgi:hypothetical protein